MYHSALVCWDIGATQPPWNKFATVDERSLFFCHFYTVETRTPHLSNVSPVHHTACIWLFSYFWFPVAVLGTWEGFVIYSLSRRPHPFLTSARLKKNTSLMQVGFVELLSNFVEPLLSFVEKETLNLVNTSSLGVWHPAARITWPSYLTRKALICAFE